MGFGGFTPEAVSVTSIISPLPLFGIGTAKEFIIRSSGPGGQNDGSSNGV
ncbi:MAG: hypothetical protein HQL20_07210 [Candidatus Omnitrophica bacterium]|nr:hypothetical protein [Candidatus Omnitrophota bacterium]